MSFRRIYDSLITRLLFLGLCLVLVGSAARYYAVSHFLYKDLSEVVESQQMALANYAAHDIDEKIIQRQTLLEGLAAAMPTGLLGQPDRLRAWLKQHYDYQPLFSSGLFVVDIRGTALADYPVLVDRVETNYMDRDYIQAALAGTSFVGRPLIGRAAKVPVLPMGAPIRNENKEIVAVLVGVTALAAPGFLNSLLQSRIGASSGGFLLVSPRDRLHVAASQPDMVLQPTPPPGANSLHDRAMGGYRGTGITVSSKGVEEVSAIASVPSTGWFVVARIPSSEAFATVERMKQILVSGTVATVAVFMALSLLGLYFVLRHLFRAATQADRMALGHAPLEPLPIARNDEVGHLIEAFNRVLARLNDNQAELARMAHHDTLTGLPNRSLLYDRLRHALAHARRTHTQVAVLFMDLDGFKRINDSHGHKAGDETLRQVANRFSAIVRESDTLARMGGDEFVLVLGDLGDDAVAVADTLSLKCIEALQAPFMVAGIECRIGVSIGVALGDGKPAPETYLLAADQAMYDAKKAGRGRHVVARV